MEKSPQTKESVGGGGWHPLVHINGKKFWRLQQMSPGRSDKRRRLESSVETLLSLTASWSGCEASGDSWSSTSASRCHTQMRFSCTHVRDGWPAPIIHIHSSLTDWLKTANIKNLICSMSGHYLVTTRSRYGQVTRIWWFSFSGVTVSFGFLSMCTVGINKKKTMY